MKRARGAEFACGNERVEAKADALLKIGAGDCIAV